MHAQGVDAGAIARIGAEVPEDAFLRFTPAPIAWPIAGIAGAKDAHAPLVLIEPHSARGGSEVFVHAPDRDGLFAVVTAVLDRMRLSVHEARIFTTRHGMCWDSFLVLDGHGRALSDPPRIERLRIALGDALAHNPYRLESQAHPLPRPLRHFPIVPRIAFDEPAANRTQLALVCSDRPGLLAEVAKVLRECSVRVHDARIATFGERVEDFFLLRTHDRRWQGGELRCRQRCRIASIQNCEGETCVLNHVKLRGTPHELKPTSCVRKLRSTNARFARKGRRALRSRTGRAAGACIMAEESGTVVFPRQRQSCDGCCASAVFRQGAAAFRRF